MTFVNTFSVHAYLDISQPRIGLKYPAYAFSGGLIYDNVQAKNDLGEFIDLKLNQKLERYDAFLGYFPIVNTFVFRSTSGSLLELKSVGLNIDGEGILYSHKNKNLLRNHQLVYLNFSKTCEESSILKVQGSTRYNNPLNVNQELGYLKIEYKFIGSSNEVYQDTTTNLVNNDFYFDIPDYLIKPKNTKNILRLRFTDLLQTGYVVEEEYAFSYDGCVTTVEDAGLLTFKKAPNIVTFNGLGNYTVFDESLKVNTVPLETGGLIGFFLNNKLIETKEINSLGESTIPFPVPKNDFIGKLTAMYRDTLKMPSLMSQSVDILGPTSNLLVKKPVVFCDNLANISANFEIVNLGPNPIASQALLTLKPSGLGVKSDLLFSLYGNLPHTIDLHGVITLGQILSVNDSILVSIVNPTTNCEEEIECVQLTVDIDSSVSNSCLTNTSVCGKYEPYRSSKINNIDPFTLVEESSVIQGISCPNGNILEIYIDGV